MYKCTRERLRRLLLIFKNAETKTSEATDAAGRLFWLGRQNKALRLIEKTLG